MHTRSLFPLRCLSLLTTLVTPLRQWPFDFCVFIIVLTFSFHQISPLLCLPANFECLPPSPKRSLRPWLTSLVSVCAKALPEEIGRELSEGNRLSSKALVKRCLTVLVLSFPSQGTKAHLSTFSSAFSLFHFVNIISLNLSLTAPLSLFLPQNELPESHAKFHVLFLFFVAAMFCISILSLFSYHLWLVGKNRSTIGKKQARVV